MGLVLLSANNNIHAFITPKITTTTTTTTTTPQSLNYNLKLNNYNKKIVLLYNQQEPLYDDEIPEEGMVKKEGISSSMRERLLKEASTGLDSDQKQSNVLLYIIVGVAVLVVLGGNGILY